MRIALLGLVPVLLVCGALPAQQATVSSQPVESSPTAAVTNPQASSDVQDALPVSAQPPTKPKVEDAISRGDAKAAARAEKEKTKADAKAQKQAEKDRKSAEEEAKFLKLQDNEIVAAAFDEQGNPVKLPPCSKKDKVCQQKRKELLKQKKIGLHVQNGTLTVDGWTGKARLNYDVKNFQYLYVSVPTYGTIVASPEHFPNSTELKNALDGQTLTITTKDDHIVQLASDELLAGKQKHSIFYSVDSNYRQPGNFPSVGYGFVNKAPYAWPGTLPLTEDQKRRMAQAPVLPKGMEAREMTLPCQAVGTAGVARQIKVNGVLVTPPVCKAGEVAGTPGAYSTAERPPDGSGAASTGIADDRSR